MFLFVSVIVTRLLERTAMLAYYALVLSLVYVTPRREQGVPYYWLQERPVRG